MKIVSLLSLSLISAAPAGTILVNTIAGPGNLGASTFDLTTLGGNDWAIWTGPDNTAGSTTPGERKAGGSGIGTLSFTPAPANTQGTHYYVSGANPLFSWSDGANTASATSLDTTFLANRLNADDGDTFSLAVDAGTQLQRLTLFVGLGRAQGDLTVSLSDGSATTFTGGYSAGSGNFFHAVYQIDFAADTDGETLTVEWEKTNQATGSATSTARFHAVALQNIPEPGSALLASLSFPLLLRRRR
ncbi:MAG: hypothetical protein ACQKBY_08895 [Verrucomicrobiales bacterium]